MFGPEYYRWGGCSPGTRRARADASLYDALRAVDADIDHHESDLYVRATPQVVAIVRASGYGFTTFRCKRDGGTWLDVPFCFDPYWDART